ncbi:MAG: zinc ribbon domain-containing protein [Haloarculaceae archaeon]
MTGRQPTKRPWLAAMLSFLQPGLGHLYLRAWIRALLWFALWFGTLTVAVPSVGAGGLLAVAERTLGALASLPTGAALALGTVTLFSTLDAYWLASRANERSRAVESGTADCPHCGREVDAELDFCHWCTEPIDLGVDREYGTGEESIAR